MTSASRARAAEIAGELRMLSNRDHSEELDIVGNPYEVGKENTQNTGDAEHSEELGNKHSKDGRENMLHIRHHCGRAHQGV